MDLPERIEAPSRLEPVLFHSLYKAAAAGWRLLAKNEYRASSVPNCSWELFYSKIYPEPAPPEEISITRDTFLKTISPDNPVPLIGTMLHEGIQKALGDEIWFSERRVKHEDPRGFVISGSIDVEYDEEKGVRAVNDIKTMGLKTYEAIITGKHSAYSRAKMAKSILQANVYACMAGAKEFTITWMSQADLQYRIDRFKADMAIFGMILDKLTKVHKCVKHHQDTGEITKPAIDGIVHCTYCRAYRRNCMGVKK